VLVSDVLAMNWRRPLGLHGEAFTTAPEKYKAAAIPKHLHWFSNAKPTYLAFGLLPLFIV